MALTGTEHYDGGFVRDADGRIITKDVGGAAGGATYVTSLPASPTDGQEIVFVADAAKGVLWRLRYNAGSASPYKWEFQGGSPLYAKVDPSETMPATYNSYVDLGTVGPSVSLPAGVGGDFVYEVGALGYMALTGAGVCNVWITPAINGTAMGTAEGAQAALANTSGFGCSMSRKGTMLAVAAAAAIRAMYRQNNDRAGFQSRWIAITPIRVG